MEKLKTNNFLTLYYGLYNNKISVFIDTEKYSYNDINIKVNYQEKKLIVILKDEIEEIFNIDELENIYYVIMITKEFFQFLKKTPELQEYYKELKNVKKTSKTMNENRSKFIAREIFKVIQKYDIKVLLFQLKNDDES